MNRSEQVNRPYVGIVKSVIKEGGYGFILVAYRESFYFRLEECQINNITPFTCVVFKKRISSRTGRIEAYNVKRVSDYKTELLEVEQELTCNERNLICYCNKDIFDKVIKEQLSKAITTLANIDAYLETFNVCDVINSYNVVVREGHICKPGGDDTASVSYVGSRSRGLYLLGQQYFWGIESLRDVYMDTILPEYSIFILSESAGMRWQDILASFGDLTEYYVKAEEKTKMARKKAVELYNKYEHKQSLVTYLKQIIKSKTEKYKECIESELELFLYSCFHDRIGLQDLSF